MRTVIVADDSIDFNSKCRDFLTKDNTIEVVQTFNGKDTFEKYKELQPDALILDYKMPKMNGSKVIDKIAEYESENNSLKRNVVMVTGSTIVDTKMFKHPKIHRFHTKPFKDDELTESLQDIFKCQDLQKRDLDKEIEEYLMMLGLKDYKSNNYKFLKYAIKLVVTNNDLLRSLNIVYYLTAQEFNRTELQIKNHIRYNVRILKNNIPKELLQSIFDVYYRYDKFTTKLFFDRTVVYFNDKERNENI